MARDRLFAPRRQQRGLLRLFVLLALVVAPALLLLRPLAGRATREEEPAVASEAVTQVAFQPAPVAPAPGISAQSAVLMDADSGTILYQRDAHAHRPMASITKMMTAILVIENAAPTDVVIASEHASLTPYTGLYLKKGEKVTVEDLLWAMILRSANDACVAAGEHVAGSEEKFVEMMNAKARELGMNDTQFKNPHGLHADGHYSSAYDMAQLARYAMHNPRFAEMAGRKRKRIDRSIEKQDVVVVNKNRLLFRWDMTDGIKTGYTRQAGHCLAASASQGGWRLIAIVLKSGDSWGDSRALLEYGFRQYQRVMVVRQDTPLMQVPVVGGIQSQVPALASRQFTTVAPKGAKVDVSTQAVAVGRLRAPVAQGFPIGALVVRRGDREMERIPLLAAASVPEAPRPAALPGFVLGGLAAICAFLSLTVVARYGRKTAQGPRRRGRRVPPGI